MRIPQFKKSLPPIGYTTKPLKQKPQAAIDVARYGLEDARSEAQNLNNTLNLISSGMHTIEKVWGTIENFQYNEQYQKAKIQAVKQIDDLMLNIQASTDYDKWLPTYEQNVRKVKENVLSQMKNQRAIEDFSNWYSIYTEKNRVNIALDVQKNEINRQKIVHSELVNQIVDLGATHPDTAIENTVHELDTMQKNGVFTDYEAYLQQEEIFKNIMLNRTLYLLQGMAQYTLVQKEQENGGLLRESDFEEVKANIGNLVNELSSEAEKEVKQKASNMGIETQVTLTGEDVKKIKQQLMDSIEQNKKIWVARKKEIVNDTVVKALTDIMEGKLTSFNQLTAEVKPGGRYEGLKLDDTAYRTIYNTLKAKIDQKTDNTALDDTYYQEFLQMFYSGVPREKIRDWVRYSMPGSDYRGKKINGITYGYISTKRGLEMLHWLEQSHTLNPVAKEAYKFIDQNPNLLPEDRARMKKIVDEKIARNPKVTTEETIELIKKITTKSPDIHRKEILGIPITTWKRSEDLFIQYINEKGATGYLLEEVRRKYKDPKTGKEKIVKELVIDDRDYYESENVLGGHAIDKLVKKMKARISEYPVQDETGRNYYLVTMRDGKKFWMTYHFNFVKNPDDGRFYKKSDRFYIYPYNAVGPSKYNISVVKVKDEYVYTDMKESDSYRDIAKKILTYFSKIRTIPVIKKRGR